MSSSGTLDGVYLSDAVAEECSRAAMQILQQYGKFGDNVEELYRNR
jgi:hypothetical protein